jgi:hypothetical protein
MKKHGAPAPCLKGQKIKPLRTVNRRTSIKYEFTVTFCRQMQEHSKHASFLLDFTYLSQFT